MHKKRNQFNTNSGGICREPNVLKVIQFFFPERKYCEKLGITTPISKPSKLYG